MAKKDYYAILGIDKKSSPEEIKKAYREKAKEHHPDRNIGDALSVSKFQEIQEAFDILSDPKKRSIYDMSGVSNMKFNQQGNWRETSFSEDSFNEFSSFFNKSKFKGRTVFYKLEVSLEDIKSHFVDTNKISQNDFEEIISAVGNKTSYATWLAKKVANNIIKGEDIYKFKKYFST